MNELFNLKSVEVAGNQIRAVDARELHTFLEVGRDFSTWIKDRIEQYGFIEGVDYVVLAKFGENTLQGIEFDSPNLGNQKQRGGDRRSKEYALSLDTAKELSMVENNEQGRIARRYFIECEKRLAAIAPEQHQLAVSNWRKGRIEVRDYQKLMVSALHLSRARQGKDTNANHYTNEANMLYKLLLGTTAN
ncbi:antA/AntB antirepressor family protein [uncultured Tolumonas sp.]|uniref:antA/AntB antirepressor family protein n=1 Tax=uncultured Tolumonas sp. TaxID=263765 RepID=UPI00292FB9EE|nr:antA/AntB antirepressor family protein [uncultured Tolumonas sp.]